jgi:hypothetical protein
MKVKEPEVLSEVGMEFDKNDVVIVAVAKIEAKIRSNVRAAKAEVKSLENEIKNLKTEFNTETKKSFPKTAEIKLKVFKDAIKKAKMSSDLEMEKKSKSNMHEESLNKHTIRIVTLDEHKQRVNSWGIFTTATQLTSRQKAILKSVEQLDKKKDENVQAGIDAKKMLQDMPAAERQMKAVVVESVLKKSKDGKALVDLLTKQYTTTMKRIEM